MSDDISEVSEELDSLELASYEISPAYFENRQSKQSNLINNLDEDFTYPLKNKIYKFLFKKNIFCKNIEIEANSSNLNGLIVKVKDYSGSEYEYKINNKTSNTSIVSINRIISEFSIVPGKSFFKKVILNRIAVDGYEEKDFVSLEKDMASLYRIKNDVDALLEEIVERETKLEEDKEVYENHVNEREENVNLLNSNIEELSEQVEKLSATKNNLKDDVDTLAAREKSLIENNEQIKNNIASLEEKSKSLNSNIVKNTQELKTLSNDRNLFAFEVKDYVKQGNKTLGWYLFLSILPWGLISYITHDLFTGSASLAKLFSEGTKLNILDLLLSRLPYVFIAGTIIIVSYQVSKVFISKVIEINKGRLSLSKIGIIAKDVSDSSLEGLDISDEGKFHLQTKLKMDLIKSHLKKDLDDDFEVKINPSLWGFYKDWLTRKSEDSGETEE